MYIDKNQIKHSSKSIGDGSYGTVFLAKYNKQKYAYKVFDYDVYFVNDEQEKRFSELCKRYNNSNLLLPKYLVGNEYIDSYLMDYYKGKGFNNLFRKPFDKKIKYLHLAKSLLIKANEDEGIIHSDIHSGNFMYNKTKETVALTDFDNAKIDDLEPDHYYLSRKVNDYLSYNNYDKYLDIYMFNLLTFALLNNMSMDAARLHLTDPEYSSIFTSKHALKTLEDISIYKKNGNYLIDMVDEKQMQKHKNLW